MPHEHGPPHHRKDPHHGPRAHTASRHAAWTHEYYEALRPRATGVYSNFLEAEGESRLREAYPEATYRRLAEVKRRYDPTNLFRLNQNIAPARSVA